MYSNNISNSKWNILGLKSKILHNDTLTKEADTTDKETVTTNIGVNLLWISSKANNIPANGAPVATANPAAAPPVFIYLPSALFFFEVLQHKSLTAVPIKTEGPSVPTGTPDK